MRSRPLDDPVMIILFVGECVMLGDIVIRFLTAYQEEGDIAYTIKFKKIANRYMKEGSFVRDLIVWIPWYAPLSYVSKTFEITALIKALRFK
jgi:hypothetical protein